MQLHAGAAAASSGEAGGSSVTVSHPASESSKSANVTPVKSSSRENTLTASGQLGAPMHKDMLGGQSSVGLVTDCSTASGAVNKELSEQLVSRGLSGKPKNSSNKGQSRTTFHNNDLETDGDGPVRPRAGQPGTAMLPGVSRVLFDNAVKENVRLKKMLQETLQKDGSSVKVFLVSYVNFLRLYCWVPVSEAGLVSHVGLLNEFSFDERDTFLFQRRTRL